MISDGYGCASGDDRLRLAVALADQGGRQATAARGTARVGWKAPADRVTDVDGAAILLEAGGAITYPHGRPLFPPAASAYRGAPMPLLAGNPTAHAQALADCRPVTDASPAEAP
jgi:fructose-1,6-bisphosphatase/inositol monophosphatase family enzyme